MFNYIKESGQVKVGKIVSQVLGLIVVIVFLFGSFGTVDAGKRGVKTRFGAVIGIVQPGLYFKLPLVDKVTHMDVRTQSMIATKQEPLGAASNDLQDTRIAAVVNYHIEPATVSNIYQQYGDATIYYQTVVDPLIIATIKATASQYTAAEQIQKRGEMSSKVLVALQSAFEGRNVAIEKADITDIAFSESFTKSIEAKVTAEQNALTEKNNLEVEKYKADQRVVQAKGEAEAIKIQAQAIQSQGGAQYVNLKAIEKWRGEVPQVTGGAVPFLNLGNGNRDGKPFYVPSE